MYIDKSPQGSEGWERIRKGKATASELDRILTPAKLQFAAGAITYAAEKAAELLGVESADGPPSYWMEYGTEMEPFARQDFTDITGLAVEEVGFIMAHEHARFGASVDGLIGDYAILEIKCVKAETLLLWHFYGVVPREHVMQLQGGMMATGRSKAAFIGWHPEIEPLILWAQADVNIIGKLQEGLVKFDAMVDSIVAKAKRRRSARLLTQYQGEERDL